MNKKINGVTVALVNELRDQFNFSPSKALGQNFLIDANISSKIADVIQDQDIVLEVGPGLGSLTIALAKNSKVLAVEFDKYMLAPLLVVLEKFHVQDNVEVLNQDIMEVDLEALCKEKAINTIVGNLPYNISAPLIIDIAKFVPSVEKIVVMVQTEVAQRLCAPLKSRNVSSATLKTQFFMEAKLLFSVPPNSFYPPPNVDSSVISLIRRTEPLVDIHSSEVVQYFALIDKAFSQRRKMLRRSLNETLGDKLDMVFTNSKVDPTLRPEQCDLDDFARLYRAFYDG